MGNHHSITGSGRGTPIWEPAPQGKSLDSALREKTVRLAILIILGIGGLTAAGIGLAGLGAHGGWWQAGPFSQLGQEKALIMIGAGGLGGLPCLIEGIVGMFKHLRASRST